MASPVGESASVFTISQLGGTYTTPGRTLSVEVLNIVPANVSVHTALTRTTGGESVVGVVEFTDADGRRTTFGGPENWAPMIFCSNLRRLTFGMFVQRSIAKAYWYALFWR